MLGFLYGGLAIVYEESLLVFTIIFNAFQIFEGLYDFLLLKEQNNYSMRLEVWHVLLSLFVIQYVQHVLRLHLNNHVFSLFGISCFSSEVLA